MNKITVAERAACLEHRESYCGHILICCDDYNQQPRIFWGEVWFELGGLKTVLRYKLENLDRNSGSYSLCLFKDQEFKEFISRAFIKYFDENSKSFKISTTFTVVDTWVLEEIYKVLHLVVCRYITQETIIGLEKHRFKIPPAGQPLSIDLVFEFNPNDLEDFQQSSFGSFEKILVDLMILLC